MYSFNEMEDVYQFDTDKSVCGQILLALSRGDAEIVDQADLYLDDSITIEVALCISEESDKLSGEYSLLNMDNVYEIQISVKSVRPITGK